MSGGRQVSLFGGPIRTLSDQSVDAWRRLLPGWNVFYMGTGPAGHREWSATPPGETVHYTIRSMSGRTLIYTVVFDEKHRVGDEETSMAAVATLLLGTRETGDEHEA